MSVNPDEVNDLDSWLRFYKLRRRNIVLGDDGSLLVLDPKTLETVKTIKRPTGQDILTLLTLPNVNRELRAAAIEKAKQLESARADGAADALATYSEIENRYLEATDAWKAATDAASRTAAALEVGKLAKQLAEADTLQRTRTYPQRFIASGELTNREINYATRDDRSSGEVVAFLRLAKDTPLERTLTEADKA